MQPTPTYQILQAEIHPDRADACGEEMIRLGADGVEHQEIDESSTRVNAYFPETSPEANRETRFAQLTQSLEGWHLETYGEALTTSVTTAPDFDWREADREANEPYELLPGLWIAHPDSPNAPPDAVRLRAGGAFGTGRHATTQLCAQALKIALEEKISADVLDIGAGSGILSILAVRWCASRVIAIDNDPEAFPYAADNIAANQMDTRIDWITCPADQAPGPCDVVVANLTAPTLLEESSSLVETVRWEGVIILGGILEEEAVEVEARFASLGLVLMERLDRQGWICLMLRKKR